MRVIVVRGGLLARSLAAVAAITLLTIPSALAESVAADGDTVTAGVQGTIDLGTVQPGADVHVDVSFLVSCTGTNHVDPNQMVRLTAGTRSIPSGGGFSVGGVTFALPAGWPADGQACPTDLAPAVGGPIHMIVTAPTTPGTGYTYRFTWNRGVTPASADDSGLFSGTNPTVTFVLDVPDPNAPPPNTPPTLVLPASFSVEGTTTGGATAAYAVSATDAEDAVAPTPSCLPAVGASLPLGTTTVSCSVTDGGGLTATGAFGITVVDTTAPVLTGMPGDQSLTTTDPSGTTLTYGSPTATDVVDASPTVGCAPASGSTIPVGDTTVTCTARDASGNQASASFVAHVAYEAPPPPPVDPGPPPVDPGPPPVDPGPPPPAGNAQAFWGAPVVGRHGHEWLVVNGHRTVPIKVQLKLGGKWYSSGAPKLWVAPCAGGSSVATAALKLQGNGRWTGHLSTNALAPGCYRVTVAAGDTTFGSFRMDVTGHGKDKGKDHGPAGTVGSKSKGACFRR